MAKTTFFNKDGQEIGEKRETDYAQIVTNDKDDLVYFVPVWAGSIYDPLGSYSTKRDLADYRRCNKASFDHYITYLETKKRKYLNHANREFMNG